MNKKANQGFGLIEALVALLIVVLGVLGLLQLQARMVVQTRTTNARATAIQLIADLGERIRLNAAGAQPGADANYSATLSPYSSLAADDFGVSEEAPDPDCSNVGTACTPAQRAAHDVWVWHRRVGAALMKGQASIWQVSPRQLQVIVAWKANENTHLAPDGATAEDREVASQLRVAGSTGTTQCAGAASGLICHIDFIDIPTN